MNRFLAAAALALVAFVVVPATASAAQAETKVTITSYTPPPLLGFWQGQVKSDRGACFKERKVILYKREGEDNAKVGSAKTQKDGDKWLWFINAEEDNGKYFAFAPPTSKCEGAESKIFRYPQDNPAPFRGFTTESRVSIDGFMTDINRGRNDGAWTGRVTSPDTGCVGGRKVTLFMKTDSGKKKIGSTMTVDARHGNTGFWGIEAPKPKRTTYFAKVKKNNACAGDTSQNFKYPQDQPLKAPAERSNKATVEIVSFQTGGPQLPLPGTFYGNVIADKDKCGKGRKITMFERTDSGNEKFDVKTRSEETKPGVYTWDINGTAQDGDTFFAKMKKKGKCKKAVSEDFVYPDDNPRAARAGKAPVELTITPWEPVGLGLGVWSGRVKSTKTKCMRNAEVTLYYSTGEDNAAIGDADIEKNNGKFFWEVVSGEPADGEYFALAKPTRACKRAESPGFDYPKG